LKDVKYQSLFYQILAHPKMYIADFEILKASYFKFYLLAIHRAEDNIQEDLKDFIKYITHANSVDIKYKQIPNKESLSAISFKIILNEEDGEDKQIILTEEDFDNIREIYLEMNGLSVEYIEEYNPELEKHLEFLTRNTVGMTLSDEIFTFCAVMKIPIQEIENYTLFQFKTHFEKLINLKEYDLYKPLVVSGQITKKGGGELEIKSYMYKSGQHGRYDAIKMDKDSFFAKNKDALSAPFE